MTVMDLMSLQILSRSYLDREGEVGEVAGKIASEYLYVLKLERVLLEGVIVRNIDCLGLWCDL